MLEEPDIFGSMQAAVKFQLVDKPTTDGPYWNGDNQNIPLNTKGSRPLE